MCSKFYLENLKGQDHLLVRLACRWKNNIEIDITNQEGVNCVYWANDKVEW
jgi:hypothetical protein